MAVWTVWEHDKFDEARRAERAVFVRDGFAWLAFLFGPFWLAANLMVLVLLAYLIVFGALNSLAVTHIGEEAAGVVSFLLSLWFGFEARALRRWSLSQRGWRLTAVVEAPRLTEAERRYFENRDGATGPSVEAHPLHSVPAVPRATDREGEVLGLFPETPR